MGGAGPSAWEQASAGKECGVMLGREKNGPGGWVAVGLGLALGFAYSISTPLSLFLIQTRFEFKYKFEFNHTQIKVCTSMNATTKF